jgi:hypothetical protein
MAETGRWLMAKNITLVRDCDYQESNPPAESRSVPIRFGNESLYVQARTKTAFDMWRNTATNYTRNSDALNDRLVHSLTVDGYLPKLNAPYQTRTNAEVINPAVPSLMTLLGRSPDREKIFRLFERYADGNGLTQEGAIVELFEFCARFYAEDGGMPVEFDWRGQAEKGERRA